MATKAAAIGKIVIGPPGQIVPASVAIRMPSKPGFCADPAQHRLARHQHRDEGRDQAGRQHLGQNVDEQREIAEQDFEKPRLPVTPIDDDGRDGDRERDDGGRPIEGLARTALDGRFGRDHARQRTQRRRASRGAAAVMPAKSPAAIAADGATQEPPTASTFGSAR